jgi:membrane dipeptidase
MKITKIALIGGIFFLGFLIQCESKNHSEEELRKKAAKIHDEVLTIDTHCDTPLRLVRGDFDIGKRNDPYKTGSKVDFIRMKEGGLDASFFAAFIAQGPRTPEGYDQAKQKADEEIIAVYNAIGKYSDMAEIALTPNDAYRIEKSGRRAIYLGLENGYPIGEDTSFIRKYYDKGIRYITLCHTKNNDICDSSNDTTEHNGLSEFGKSVIQKMNEIGIIVDVSHISDSSFYDVIGITKAPVIASHSSARTVCDNPRNLSDDMLKKLAQNGGVIQICIFTDYIKESESYSARDSALQSFSAKYPNLNDLPEEVFGIARAEWYEINKKYPKKLAAVADVVDHIDHIVKVAGIDHVGIGTDFDGGGGVEGCFDVSEMGNITLELVKRGYSEKEIEKIWGGNFMRVFREVNEISKSLQQI